MPPLHMYFLFMPPCQVMEKKPQVLSFSEGVQKPRHADSYVYLELPVSGRSILASKLAFYFSMCL